MSKLQFRVLYREFLFRMVDLELLSPEGDVTKLLGQFAALLVFVSSALSLAAIGVASKRVPYPELLLSGWAFEHMLIATTMLVVGLFAVLSWDSTFPDRRDVLVLAPLPVRARTLFLAKVAASATALSLTVASINAITGWVFPLSMAPDSTSVLNFILSPERYRLLAAYWATMLLAGAFVFGSVLGLQGIAVQLLPRRYFLQVSALLQMAAFCLFVSVYLLQPSWANPAALGMADHQARLAWLPSYWFFGLFHQLNGSAQDVTIPLAHRAWMGLAVVGAGTAVAYGLSYFRTLRKIVEEPDIVPGTHQWLTLPRFGGTLTTAVLQFSIRTLLRSRQHRLMLAFYLGIGFAFLIVMSGGPARREHFAQPEVARLLFSSFVMMCAWVIGMRVVFSMPMFLKANWLFRVTQVRAAREYRAVVRRPLFLMAVIPMWIVAAVPFLMTCPWRIAAAHLTVVGLWGMLLAYLLLHGFQKIPFTCSYLPGKSYAHMMILGAAGLQLVIVWLVTWEQGAVRYGRAFGEMQAILAAAVLGARWWTLTAAREAESVVQYEEVQAPAVQGLGLYRDGVLPQRFYKT